MSKPLLGFDFRSVAGVGAGEYAIVENNNQFLKRLVNNLRLNFVELGLYLLKFKGEGQFHYYYDSFSDYVENELQFNKSTAYNMMAIAERFTVEGTIKPAFENYSYSQLNELKSLSDSNILENYPSSLSVSQIKDKKKNQLQSAKDDFQSSGKFVIKHSYTCHHNVYSNDLERGSGGAPFIPVLSKIIDEITESGVDFQVIIKVKE